MIARSLSLAALAVALATGGAAAQPPAGADLVPPNAAAFVTVKVSDLWDSEQLKPARDVLAKDELKVVQQIDKAIGIAPADAERVTLFWPALHLSEAPFLAVTTRKPFNEARLLRALRAQPLSAMGWHGAGAAAQTKEAGAAPKSGGPDKKDPDPCAPQGDNPADDAWPGDDLFYLPDHRPYELLYLADDRTVLFLPEVDRGGGGYAALVAQLLKRKAGPLSAALAASAKHTVVAAAKVPPLDWIERGNPAALVPFRALMRAKVVAVTADLGATAKLTATLTFTDAAAAGRAEPVLKTLLQMTEEQLATVRKGMAADAEFGAVFLPLVDMAAKSLAKAEVKADGATVVASAEAELGPAVTKAVAAAPQVIQASSERMRTLNNLKQIGLAIHNYHDVNNQMPTDILDPTGKPILSWRVQILPYLEQDHLYKQLDLTKPWDDPVNKRLLETMPEVFRVYGRDVKVKGMTYLQMPSADKPSQGQPFGDPFKVRGQRRNFASITDGLSNTFMVVEAEDPVLWMKPDDVKYDPKNLPKLGAPDRNTFQVLFGDGSVRSFQRKKLADADLQALLTINGGEVVNIDR